MTQTHLKDLSRSYPAPNPGKFDHAIGRLEHMKKFYADKSEIAPEAQAKMFKGFVLALKYSVETLKTHRALTIKLTLLSSEPDDEPRTDSQS